MKLVAIFLLCVGISLAQIPEAEIFGTYTIHEAADINTDEPHIFKLQIFKGGPGGEDDITVVYTLDWDGEEMPSEPLEASYYEEESELVFILNEEEGPVEQQVYLHKTDEGIEMYGYQDNGELEEEPSYIKTE